MEALHRLAQQEPLQCAEQRPQQRQPFDHLPRLQRQRATSALLDPDPPRALSSAAPEPAEHPHLADMVRPLALDRAHAVRALSSTRTAACSAHAPGSWPLCPPPSEESLVVPQTLVLVRAPPLHLSHRSTHLAHAWSPSAASVTSRGTGNPI